MTNGSLTGRCAAAAAAAVLALSGCNLSLTPLTAPTAPPTPPPTTEPGGGGSDDPSDGGGQSPVPAPSPVDEDHAWKDVVDDTRSGVVHLNVVGCDPEAAASGSGFLIAPDLVVTAAHVVEGASSTVAAVDEQLRDARVLGMDTEADLALLELDEPVDGYTFSWAAEEAAEGDDVAALGFPLGGDFSIVDGIISGHAGEAPDPEWLTFTAPVNPGNSGGAVVTLEGEVVGVVSSRIEQSSSGRPVSGIAYSISHTTARPLVDAWIEDPQPPEAPECVDDDADSIQLTADTDISDPDVLVAALTVLAHGEAINHGSYESAFALFTPRMQGDMGDLGAWSEGLSTSYWTDLTLTDHTITDAGVDLRMTLRTEQFPDDGPNGMACSDWDLTYALVLDEELEMYLIDEVRQESDPVECTE